MKLDSARELKQRVLVEHIRPLALEVDAHALRSTGRSAAARKIGAAPLSEAESEDLGHLIAISAQAYAKVPEQQRTIAVGIAAEENGEHRLAIRVQRRALLDSPYVEKLVKAAAGEVDLQVIGRAVKLSAPWYRQNCRPLNIGSSVGHIRVTAGTVGAFVRKRGSGGQYILSCNHVLANENKAKKGDVIVQRGHLDGGRNTKADRVATLDSFVKLTKTSANLLDCAIAEVSDPNECDRTTMRDLLGPGSNGTLRGVAPESAIDKGVRVRKVGRTTGARVGKIKAFEIDNVVLNYDMGNIRFDDQVEIESSESRIFSDGGDSGSLIVDDEGLALALLFGGSELGSSNGLGLTYATPIGRVLDALKAELILD